MDEQKTTYLSNTRRSWLQRCIRYSLGLATLAGVSSGAFAYKQYYENLHDLSVVGNGVATVVQVHDVNCRYCQRLRSNVRAVSPKFEEDQLQIRIADIGTSEGAAFASLYSSQHVTLLFFDKRGHLIQRMQGVSSEEEIERAFRQLAGRTS